MGTKVLLALLSFTYFTKVKFNQPELDSENLVSNCKNNNSYYTISV